MTMLRAQKCATCMWTMVLINRTTVRVCPRCDLAALIPNLSEHYLDPPRIRPAAPDHGGETAVQRVERLVREANGEDGTTTGSSGS